jgi:hypothetical protein
MNALKRYEIFHRPVIGEPVWLESAETLEEAGERLRDLATDGGDYFGFDRNNCIFFYPPEANVVPFRTRSADGHSSLSSAPSSAGSPSARRASGWISLVRRLKVP